MTALGDHSTLIRCHQSSLRACSCEIAPGRPAADHSRYSSRAAAVSASSRSCGDASCSSARSRRYSGIGTTTAASPAQMNHFVRTHAHRPSRLCRHEGPRYLPRPTVPWRYAAAPSGAQIVQTRLLLVTRPDWPADLHRIGADPRPPELPPGGRHYVSQLAALGRPPAQCPGQNIQPVGDLGQAGLAAPPPARAPQHRAHGPDQDQVGQGGQLGGRSAAHPRHRLGPRPPPGAASPARAPPRTGPGPRSARWPGSSSRPSRSPAPRSRPRCPG